MIISNVTLLNLRLFAPIYLYLTAWKVLKEWKINRKKSTERGNRRGKTRKKKQNLLHPANIKFTSSSISTVTTSRTTKLEQSQAVKGVNFFNLRNI